jgi:alkanesulfonate monooxygenase SsuD/methylene tetrahydromethanopterin reductase-like flavin-dependent oxidoreductase (luciferase family)
MQLQDLAQVVRSKNAGPRRITLDVIFGSDVEYQRAAQSEALTAEKIAPLLRRGSRLSHGDQQSIMQFYRTLGVQLEGSARKPGARMGEQRTERGQALQTISYEDALRNKVIVGTPGPVAMRLQELTRNLGLNGVLAELNCGGLLPNEKVMLSLQLMCEEVAPRFR